MLWKRVNIIITAKVVRKFCFLSILLVPKYVVVWAARPQQAQVPIDKQEKSYQPFLYGFSKLLRIIQSLLYIEKQISKS